jgi:hypothetical protein
MGKNDGNVRESSWQVGPSWYVGAVVVGIAGGVLMWVLGVPKFSTILQWLVALLPGSIIATHVIYLEFSRKKQYREALNPTDKDEVNRLANLYFGSATMAFRYVAPAVLVTALCGTIIGGLVNPQRYFPWLYASSLAAKPATVTNSDQATLSNLPDGLPQAANGVASGAEPPSAESAPTAGANTTNSSSAEAGASPGVAKAGTKQDTSSQPSYWPPEGTSMQTFRGAALGFVGAYVYLLLMLTDRARQRDITTGIATWAAAMPVLGLLMGGVASLIITSGLGPPTEASWTRDAIFFVAGMLPRQFAGFVQSGVQKMFQQGTAPTIRTLPLTTLRGVGPDVAARLEEEGIHDVSALAYASPHQLIRATTYSPRQIVDWIDEALLIATVPSWEAIEKAGVTGALDLSWYHDHEHAIAPLANEIKMEVPLVKSIVLRLWEDAQVSDLRQLYWDKAPGASIKYRFNKDTSQEQRDKSIAEIRLMTGVRSVTKQDDVITIDVDTAQRQAVDNQLRGKHGIAPQS